MDKIKSLGEGTLMSDQNDHDLLISLSTKMDMMLSTFSGFMETTGSLRDRITALENKDSRDSEKVQSIRTDVQRSLDNGSRITVLETTISNQKEEIAKLQSKSNLFDVVNALLATGAGILGFFFGSK